MTANPKIDQVWRKEKKWLDAFEKLRAIILDCGLEENLKWGQACYSRNGQNVVLIHGFKDYCALLFFKGALMEDPKGILVQQTENVQSARQIRFTALADVQSHKSVLRSYIRNAIAVEHSGVKVAFKKTAEFTMPEEFSKRIKSSTALKEAFAALTPGRQRGYLLHFSSAKQAVTREGRIDKCVPRILNGKGLND